MKSDHSSYYDGSFISEAVDLNLHRDIIGGHWDAIGDLQFRQLVDSGLAPGHKLLDIGCGSLRGGVRFVRYLEAGHYYGLDLNVSLLDAGYDREIIPSGLAEKLPRENLVADSHFDFTRFDAEFDFALAFSLFTHLPLDVIRVCLERLAAVMKPGGSLLATFFEAPDDVPTFEDMTHPPGEITTHAGADPYHQRFADFEYLAGGLPWDVSYVGDFGHPRGQRLIRLTRREPASRISPVRSLSVEEAHTLGAGEDHYRAYVGPPERYDFIGASQFNLLFQLGLRDTDPVLDFGCGSLRLGRLLIPFLRAGNYAGIDPNRWLIEDGIDRELGRSAIALKAPLFAYNDDFDSTVFGRQFRFVIAQSIVTHTGPDLMQAMFAPMKRALQDNGLFLFSYIREPDSADSPLPATGWHYPGCVGYTDGQLVRALRDAGLQARPIPWYHPGASWMIAARDESALPPDDVIDRLTGTVVVASH